MSAPLQWVLSVFFQFCLSRELIVRRDISGISCVRRERAGVSLVLHLLSVSRVPVSPAARSQPPLACQAVLEESRVSLHYPVLPLTQHTHTIAGMSPNHGQWHLCLCPASWGNTRQLHCIPCWGQTFPCSSMTCHMQQIRHRLL